MYAVVSSGGKQYRVEPGATLVVERVAGEPGAEITFERVLLLGDGDQVTVGTPTVDGVSVRGTVLGDERGPKLIVFKYRPKARYRRRVGHRQHLTRVRIDAIDTPDGARSRVHEVPQAQPDGQAPGPTDAAPGPAGESGTGAPAKTAPAEEAAPAEDAAQADEAAQAKERKPRRRTRAPKTEE